MASKRDLELIQQGVYAWNCWRANYEQPVVDLICADLPGADLVGVDLVRVEIPRANFSKAHLTRANLSGAIAVGAVFTGAELDGVNAVLAILSGTDLSAANLSLANLSGANLVHARLTGANLMHANLIGANLMHADLRGANLSGADLSGANLIHARLDGANLSLATFCQTILGAVDVAAAEGLATCQHLGPSIIDHHTLGRSGPLPVVFLRGCGLPDDLIERWSDGGPRKASEGRADWPVAGSVQVCFIMYSRPDQDFAERFHGDLQERGIRCWLAPQDVNAGGRFRGALDDMIGNGDQLVIVLSESCVRSTWVEKQVRVALDGEQDHQQLTLFAVCLDDSALSATSGWPALVANRREAGDLRSWKDPQAYRKALDRFVGAMRSSSPHRRRC